MDVRRRPLKRAVLAAIAVALLIAAPAHADSAAAPTTVSPQPAPAIQTPIGPIEQGKVSEQQAIAIARLDPNAAEALRRDPTLHPTADRAGDDDWEIGFSNENRKLVEVVVSYFDGRVEESWTGDQVAWKMARGYEGAFGRTLNAPWVWIPLCLIFVAGLLDWRRLRRPAHLDLLMIVGGFGVSHYFFNRGEIGLSVPLAYIPLVYLLGRMLWRGFRGGGGLRPSLPAAWIAVAAILLLGARIGLNLADSNVIDVGYAGVIGADLIGDGEPVYGSYPAENHAGDTYGPVNYYAYVPFEQAIPWSGEWDELPAAHGAAILFELLTVGGLFWLGRRLGPDGRGDELGAMLAFGWVACPYSAYALESNTNDALVSALLVGALLVLTSPARRGAMLALATLTKFAPLALVPLFGTYRPGRPPAIPRSIRGTVVPYVGAFAAVAAAVMVQTLIDPGLGTFWDRTIGNQAGRDSPFSVWGQDPSLEWLHTAVKIFAAGLALLVAFVPRRRGPGTIAALAAAVIIALQLTVEHWFYLYIPWFLPLVLVALLVRDGDENLLDGARQPVI